MKYITTINDKEYIVDLVDEKHVSVNGKVLEVDFATVSGQPVFSLLVDGRSYEAYIYENEDGLEVLLHGHFFAAQVKDERERGTQNASAGNSPSGEFVLKAPMPGLIVAVPVEDGQQVEKGQTLLILESMKMQNELKSPRAGTVTRIKVNAGDRVEQKAVLLAVT
jgi:biotin carboxyl carrier protein